MKQKIHFYFILYLFFILSLYSCSKKSSGVDSQVQPNKDLREEIIGNKYIGEWRMYNDSNRFKGKLKIQFSIVKDSTNLNFKMYIFGIKELFVFGNNPTEFGDGYTLNIPKQLAFENTYNTKGNGFYNKYSKELMIKLLNFSDIGDTLVGIDSIIAYRQ